ncbi:hypothetical protein BT96DRAFT_993680 [Gymnopus androsaceus JB14]|uniref:Uncharacterized protein n=1 Tax=Gymnopus androsaceus JB14 TaxID=1447944 RepID=A0A6A4HP05_9AGAR|nr:hypothetical protein BT96DRAFT_993680 [Gymnopus androsaceus JB14]
MSQASQTIPPDPVQPVEPPAKPKTQWNLDDDTFLLDTLEDQKAAGFQTDNGNFHQDAYQAAAAAAMPDPGSRGPWKNAQACQTCYITAKVAQNKLLYDRMAALLENQVATGAAAFFPGSQSQQSPDDDGSQITTAGDDNDSDEGNNTDRDAASVQTPACCSLAWSSSGNSFSTISRKHLAATPDSSEHPMKHTHGRKPTQSDAGFEMADAMHDLACSALGDAADPSILSPALKKRAIECIEADNELLD